MTSQYLEQPHNPAVRIRPGAKITRPMTRSLRRRKPKPPPDNPHGDGHGSRLSEWHAMTAEARNVAWRNLVDWVAWLHDRYELSIEERLPPCWPQHPGLIEELSALKTWRDDIYTTEPPADVDNQTGHRQSAAVGQAARYWHTELRAVITAAATVYAAGCRSGHTNATTLNPDLHTQWLATEPPVTAGPQWHSPPAASAKPTMAEAAITRALADGTATPLSQHVPEFVHHDGTWWHHTGDHWTAVTDPDHTDRLNTAANLATTTAAASPDG